METSNLVNTMVKAATPKALNATASTDRVNASKAVADKAVADKAAVASLSGSVLPQEGVTEQSSAANKVQQTVSDLNSFVQNIQRGIQFSVHEETGHSIITVTDKDTGDVIRTFPSEQALEIAAYLAENKAQADDSVRGLLVNESA